MSANSKDKRMNQANTLTNIKIPTLDLYGEDDLAGVLKTVTLRAGAANKAGNEQYTQVMIKGAGHFFDGKDDELIATVTKWLKQF